MTGNELGQGLGADQVKAMGFALSDKPIPIEILQQPKVEIKPCPFCGSKAAIYTGGFGEKFVTCTERNCGGRLGTGIWFVTEKMAIEIWNKRVEQKQ